MYFKNYSFNLSEAKKFLNKRGLELFKKSNQGKTNNNYRSFNYTVVCSLIIIFIFAVSPKIVILKNSSMFQFVEVKNNSKTILENVLLNKNKEEKKEENKSVKNYQIFEDIFEYEDIPTATIRLSASTIRQIFEDTNYNLKDVRKNKLVKPVNLDHLPKEMKMIENTKKRKNLFIQIVLPLILEENNQIKLNRKKLFSILNKNNNSEAEKKWLNMKFKQYGINNKDLSTLKIRMDVVPVSLAIAQAAKETGWGTSRFAQEGNALFGQWTFSGEGLKPLSIDTDKNHKVMKFIILQSSIRAYHRNLNTHSSYKKFRKLRAESRDNDEKLNSLLLAECLDKYAATGSEYTEILKKTLLIKT